MNKYTKASSFLQNQFDDLSSKEKNDFLRDLESFLKDQDSAYYGSNISNISDAEYDKLKLLYHKLVTNNPEVIDSNYSNSVGFKPSDKFEKVNHKVPMLSLSNIFDNDGVTDFIERVRRYLSLGPDDNLEIVSEPKIDGLSATLIYINGNLHIGATRGDGSQGENVTQNIKTISKGSFIAERKRTIERAPTMPKDRIKFPLMTIITDEVITDAITKLTK